MSFFSEIRRRKVFQVAAVYLVAAWLIMQVVDVVNEPLRLPEWFATVAILFLAIGFPIAVILSWAYELTPGGVERTEPVAAGDPEPTETIAATTGLALSLTVIFALALLMVLVGLYVVWRAEPTAIVGETDVEPSIAVLPLDNLSPDTENAYFADAIHGEILMQLSKIGALKVISQTSVMEYRETPKNIREIGAELDVATILEGSVQRLGDSVRINVQLIDAETDDYLWTNTYDRELSAENIFAIQSEMATAIAGALQTALSPQEVARLNERPTESTEAYSFYLAGKDYSRRTDVAGNRLRTAEMYQRAVDADPDFALAWAELSMAHTSLYWSMVDRTESRLAAALEAVERAVALQPDLPEAHLAMADYYYRVPRDFERALEELELAERGIPGSAQLFALRAYIQRRLPRIEESLKNWRRAIELDPRAITYRQQEGLTVLMLRDYGRAAGLLERAFDLAPDSPHEYRLYLPVMRDGDVSLLMAAAQNPSAPALNWVHLGWLAALYERDWGQALAFLDDSGLEIVEDVTATYAPTASYRGVAYALAGQPELAETQFRDALALIRQAMTQHHDDFRLDIALGEALAGLGEHEAAVAAAERALAAVRIADDAFLGPQIELEAILRVFIPAGDRDAAIEHLNNYLLNPGFWSMAGLLPDPRFDKIREDPSFVALVEEYSRR